MNHEQEQADNQELETRLAAAESIVEALRNQKVDAVVGAEKIAFLLLREVEEALRSATRDFVPCSSFPGRRHGPSGYSRFPLHQSQPEVL